VNGELAQVVCLAGHGSAWLAGRTGPEPPPSEEANSAFRFVGALGFSLDGDPVEEGSGSVADWLRGLRARRVDRLWLVTGESGPGTVGRAPFEERYLVAFAGAGSWRILATAGPAAEVWRASWTVGDPDAPDQRIWHVHYHGTRLDETTRPPRPSPAEAALHLREAVRATREFAVAQGLAEWADVFGTALDPGASAETEYPDLLPASAYPPESIRLVEMAARAWVFGGMGSWNDLGFDDTEVKSRYEKVSEDLYRSALAALVAATNGDLTPRS
jgi:hypothetical protein